MTTAEMEKSFQELWALFKETDTRLDQRIKETDARLDKRFKETDQEIKKLANLFTGQWGKLIESLAESGILEQLQSRGIMVTNLARRLISHKNGHHMELDFLLTNDTEAVIGEVKTTLRNKHVQRFIQKIKEFHIFYPNYRHFKLYGAMISIRMEQEVDKYAYRKGLFVFQVGGKGMLKMLNDADFKPKDFNWEAKTN
jgi:hypothetical protein